jgi:hypothetical protein
MEHIRIENTDIIFQEIGDGKGKIIISDDEYGYNFSYYWGAIPKGKTLKQFIQSSNCDYFVNKLSHKIKGPIDSHKTFVKLRAYIQECFKYELRWFEHMEFQKDFRKKIKKLQNEVSCEAEFIEKIDSFYWELDFYLIKDETEKERVRALFSSMLAHVPSREFIKNKTSKEDIFLEKLHKKIKKALSKPVQLCLL